MHPPTAAHARIMEKAGCEALFVDTGGVVGAYTGLADVGTATMTECVTIAGWIADSVSIPVIMDGDTGHGGIMAVRSLALHRLDAATSSIPRRPPIASLGPARCAAGCQESKVRNHSPAGGRSISNFRFRVRNLGIPLDSTDVVMASATGLTRDRAADFFGKCTYLRGCGGHTGLFDDAKPRRHRLRQCNTVADPGRRDRGTGAGKISGNLFGEPRTRRHSIEDNK